MPSSQDHEGEQPAISNGVKVVDLKSVDLKEEHTAQLWTNDGNDLLCQDLQSNGKHTTNEDLCTLPEHVYNDIDDDEFRLIRLRFACCNVLEFSLETFKIGSAPVYDALSYVWEEESKLRTSKANCDQACLYLSPDLHSALQRVRYFQQLETVEDPRVHYVWNDFTCINQRKLEERKAQVARMADIYSAARRTLVWLGPEHNGAQSALLGISGLVNYFAQSEGRLTEEDPVLKQTIDHDYWGAVSHVLHRSWFQRLWVIQEAVLASDIVVLCGEVAISWELLYAFAEFIASTGLIHLSSGEYYSFDMASHGIRTILGIQQLRHMKNEDVNERRIVSFTHIAKMAEGKRCLQNVDRIWALIGMLPEFLRENLLKQNFIDYSEHACRNYHETFKKVAKWQMDWDLSLGLLSLASCSPKNNALPTWCPDWSAQRICSSLAMNANYSAGRRERETEDTDTAEAPYVRLSMDNDILHVKGFRVDVIAYISSAPWDFQPTSHEEDQEAAVALMD